MCGVGILIWIGINTVSQTDGRNSMMARLLLSAALIMAAIVATSCQAENRADAPKAEKQTASESPSPTVEVAWFSSDKLLRFVAPIGNSGDRPIEGLETEWIAYDANNTIIGSFRTKRSFVPARGTLPYVGGQLLSDVPARIEVRITDPGRYSDSPPALEVTNVLFLKQGYGDDYKVTADGMVDTEVASSRLGAYIILKNGSGEIVGADFWSPWGSLPSILSARTKFKIEELVSVSGKPASADVVLVLEQ